MVFKIWYSMYYHIADTNFKTLQTVVIKNTALSHGFVMLISVEEEIINTNFNNTREEYFMRIFASE